MKFVKGCLITFILFVVIFITGWFFLENNVSKNLAILNQNVEKNWENYIVSLKERNTEFSQQKIENDSLKCYLENSKRIINSKDYLEELELNEYKFNRIAMSKSLKSNLNEKLNLQLENYNKAVREYNVYRIRFPNYIVARRMNFRKAYEYFDIRYGFENEKVMTRKKEVKNWIKNGGEYPK